MSYYSIICINKERITVASRELHGDGDSAKPIVTTWMDTKHAVIS